ncbi:hypothetical protein ACFLXE_07525 [Chloroflexota bacterium]
MGVVRYEMWCVNEGMNWWMVFGLVWPLLFFGAMMTLIVWGSRRFSGHSGSGKDVTPLAIAEVRYARGEISKEEFDHIRSGLA